MIFKRPWIVFVLVLIVLAFSLLAWIRFGTALSVFDYLNNLPLSVSPLYLAASGAVWGLLGLGTAGLLWFGWRHAPALLRILGVTYAVYYWIEQFALMQSPLRDVNWVFSGILTAFFLILIFVSFLHPAVHHFFGDAHDRFRQD